MRKPKVRSLGEAAPIPMTQAGHPAWKRPITPKQLAKFLQVSPRTVRRLAAKRDFPKLRVAGQVRFVPDDVMTYLKKKS